MKHSKINPTKVKRIKKLFMQIEKMKEEEDMIKIYEAVITIIKDALRIEGIEIIEDKNGKPVTKDRQK